MPDEVSETAQLVVEGGADEAFFKAMLEHLQINTVQVQNCRGKDRMKAEIGALARSPGFEQVTRLGVVRDADLNPAGALDSLRGALAAANLPAPIGPDQQVTGGRLTVAIWILPDSERTGELETLLCESLVGSEVGRCINEFIECAGITPTDKARANAFVALQDPPDVSVGSALQRGDWNLNHDCFEDVRRFLNNLFRDPSSPIGD